MHSSRNFATVLAAALTTAVSAVGVPAVASASGHAHLPSGVDVSGYQRPGGAAIDWHEVKTDGQSFAVVKASEGTDWVNDFAAEDVDKAAAAGLKVGAYHYARPGMDARAQARHFADQLKNFPGSSLPPVLDIEVDEGKSPKELTASTHDFLDELESRSGQKPMVYTYPYFWLHNMGNATDFAQYPLWLAAYQNTAPKPVGGWSELAMWQRTGTGRVGGITGNVDLNVFNGTPDQLTGFQPGGHLDGVTIEDGPSLGGGAKALIDAVLTLNPGVIKEAEKAGIDPDGAKDLLELVGTLYAEGKLPVDELRDMAENGATVSDLVILLDNAANEANA